MNQKMQVYLLATYLLLTVSAGQAQTTYYVSPAGKNSNNGKSLEAPWRTINYAAQQVEPGDVVLIREGTYQERVQVTTYGAPGQEVVFKNYGDEQPIIDGSSISFPDDYQRRGLFEINSARYIRIEGLTAKNATGLSLNGCGFLVNGPDASHITINRCTTNNTPSSGIAAWGNTGVADYDGVTNLVIENCTVVGAMNGGFQEHITIADGVENYEVRFNVVRDGQIPHPDNFPIGIDSKIDVRNGKVYGNEIYNLTSSNGIYVDSWNDEAYNIEIFNNIIYDVEGIGIVVGGEAGGTSQDIRIYNNVIYRAGTDGLKVSASYGNPTIYNTYWYHNTVYDCRSSMWVEGNSGTVEVYNNIFSQSNWNNGIYIYTSNESNVKATNNLIDDYRNRSWNDPPMKEIKGDEVVEQSPQFVNAGKENFRLKQTSPAIDAGMNSTSSTDFEGKPRPIGDGHDLGAYEFGTPSSNPPTAGTGLTYTLYDNKSLSGSPVKSGTDATVNFNWQSGGKTKGLSDHFSLRWTGQVQPKYSETYTFSTHADDGTRLWVNGKLLIDDWTNHAVREKLGKITLQAGKKYDIKLEYYENRGKAVCKLLWKSPSQSKQIIPKGRLYPASNTNARQAPTTLTTSVKQFNEEEIRIFPNPTRDGSIMLQGTDTESIITLYNTQGQHIPVQQQAVGQGQIRLVPQLHLTPGLYTVHLRQADGRVLPCKLVVK